MAGDLGEGRGVGVGEAEFALPVPHRELQRAAVHIFGDGEVACGGSSVASVARQQGAGCLEERMITQGTRRSGQVRFNSTLSMHGL